MANSRTSGSYKEYITVNTAPGVDGYFTNPVGPRNQLHTVGARNVFFSVRDFGTSASMVITIQFKCTDDTDWTDYGTTSAVQRNILTDKGTGVQWRAGVKQGDYTSGTLRIGFDW